MFKFRRRPAADTGHSELNPLQGVVILDNTTVFGARHAFEWDPALPTALPSGVDLRSLMDVLEAIVLFNDFAVDASSREYYAWPELNDISAKSGSFFRDTTLLTSLGKDVDDALITASAEKTRRLLDSGELVRHLGFLPSTREIEILPPLYRDSDQFVNLTLWSSKVEPNARWSPEQELAWNQLRELTNSLESYSQPIRDFAFFAFRGFYYQDLAHLLSASYMPHTWRSSLIRRQLERPVANFSDLVLDETGKLRDILRQRINREFGVTTLSADFPLIASYVVGQSRTRSELLRTAVEIRRTAKATAFRNWIYDIERKLRNESSLAEIRTAQDELRTVVRELERELGISEQEKQEVKLKLGLPLASVETTGEVSASLPAWMRRVLLRRTHLVFLRELARESTRLAPFTIAFQQLAP